jgi:hypothetical protein
MKARICIGREIKYGSGSSLLGESGPKSKPNYPITQKVEKKFQFDKNRTFAIKFNIYFRLHPDFQNPDFQSMV